MKVSTSWRDRVLVASLSGEIDAFDADGMGDVLDELARVDSAGIVVNCREVTYIASLGLGMVVNLARMARTRGIKIRIAGASPAVRMIFDSAGLDAILPHDTTIEDAIDHLAIAAHA